MSGYAFISYGLGGTGVETWDTGLRLLVSRCKAIGVNTMASPYSWSDVNTIVAAINKLPTAAKIAVGGASLGDDEAPDIASRTPRTINYLFGFQDSSYGVDVGVPKTALNADNIYNPSWWQTFGLGSRQWHLAPGNAVTKLRNIPIYAPHPDDWGAAQDIVFAQIHKLVGTS